MRLPGRTRRPGLTLIEVIGATAMLAMIAAACLPLLTQATRAAADASSRLIKMLKLVSGEDIVADVPVLGPLVSVDFARRVRLALRR